jgi:aminodeoxychorismate synthase component I
MPRHVAVRELDSWRDPEAVFLALGADAGVAVWLDGGIDAVAGRSVIAIGRPDSTVLVANLGEDDPDAVLARLRTTLAANAVSHPSEGGSDTPSAHSAQRRVGADLRRFAAAGERTALGWIGWFGYEFGASRLGVPVSPTDAPDAAWLFADRAIVFDHASRTVRLEWLPAPEGDAWAERIAAQTEGLDPGTTPALGTRAAEASAHPTSTPDPVWRHDAETYARLIAACQAAIARGDAYQLCLTNRVDVDVRPDPLETYLRLRRSSPTHHGGYLRFGDVALLSASPEQFLLVEPDGRVSTKPMKGTRPRGSTPAEDDALRRELLESDKERAENLMIVDLMRNDLTRVAELGSVHVSSLLEVEEYPHVHQLVSTVAARLRPPFSAVDAVAAAFPAGSMTGAPKLRAMELLHELEAGPRGVYSGVFGSLSVDGGADLAMVIRSILVTNTGTSIGTGGGITALSEADAEIEETRVKAGALLAVLADRGTRTPRAGEAGRSGAPIE